MFGRTNNLESNAGLDRVSIEIVRAAAANEAEGEAVAAAPFLYTRLRARIASERARREEGERWFALFGVSRHAVPAMLSVAILAVVLFWSASFGTMPQGTFSDEALLGERDAGIEHVVFADRRSLSSDEVLATILNEDDREASR